MAAALRLEYPYALQLRANPSNGCAFFDGTPTPMPAGVVPECQVRKIHDDGKEALCP
jgi:hypothetical protein